MKDLNELALYIALLSDRTLGNLADILVKDHPARAEALQNLLCWAEFDHKEIAE